MSSPEEALARVEKFWEQNGIKLKCPVCGHNDFSITRDAEIYVPATRSISTQRLSDDRLEMSSYGIHCDNCGFTLNFKKTVVDKEAVDAEKTEQQK